MQTNKSISQTPHCSPYKVLNLPKREQEKKERKGKERKEKKRKETKK